MVVIMRVVDKRREKKVELNMVKIRVLKVRLLGEYIVLNKEVKRSVRRDRREYVECMI